MNIATALVFLALSAVLVTGTWNLPYWSDFAPGPAFAAIWTAAAASLLALMLLIQERRMPSLEPADWPGRSAFMRVVITTAALCVTLVLAPTLGFPVTVALLTFFVLTVVERRRLVPSLIVTALTTALIHGVFVAWLNVALPKGILGI
ncbi:MAG TPA: tripartite tricarboxylate transporter TctB family protein [Beijerinckiaceae bacterium]